MTRRCIGRENLTATCAPTRCDAVPRSRPARSRAAFMKRPAMLPVRSPAPRLSNNPVGSESGSRCCLPISSASLGSVVSGYAGHTVRKTSSRSPRSLRTYAVSPSCKRDRHPWLPRVLRERRVAFKLRGGRRYQSVAAAAPTGASGKRGPHRRSPRDTPAILYRLLQRNLPGSDSCSAANSILRDHLISAIAARSRAP